MCMLVLQRSKIWLNVQCRPQLLEPLVKICKKGVREKKVASSHNGEKQLEKI